jgi:hypothetical protein
MSHQRRVPALLSSMNSHRHASLAQRRTRRSARVNRSAADRITGKRFLLHYVGGPPDFYELGEPAKPFGLADPPAKS